MSTSGPLRLALVYAAFGALWIVATDWIVEELFSGGPSLVVAQTVKGLLYIGATTALVYWLAKRSRRAVESDRDWYRDLFELSPEALFIVGPDGRFVEVNEAAVERYGFPHDTWKDRDLADLTAPGRREADRPLLDAALAAPARFETRHVATDGRELDVEVASRPLHHDGRAGTALAVRDLSGIRRAETELRESEWFQRALIEACPLALFTLDMDGNVRTWNATAERIFGWSAAEIVGRPLPIVPDDRREEFAALRARSMAGERLAGVELVRQRKDGSQIRVSLSTAPVAGPGGEVTAIMAAIEDISQRKEAEQALRHSQWMLARTEKIAGIGSWEWDVATDTTIWSDELFRIFGLDPGRGAPGFAAHDELLHPEDMARLRDCVDAATSHGTPYELEVRAMRPDGDVRRCLARGLADKDPSGRVVRLYGSVQDVTERRRGDIARERLLRAIEQADEAILITDVDGKIEYVNPAFERITGYSRDEALGQNPRMLKSGEQGPEVYRDLWETITSGEIWHGRMVNQRKDGSHYTEDVSISPVRDAAGEIVNFVAVKRDVTRELSLEEQLFQAQKLDSIGRLAGGLAHDFNNMLTLILGHVEIALEQASAGEPAQRDHLEQIRSAAERSADLVRQLLSFAREQIRAPRVLDLNQAVEARLAMLHRLIGEDIDLLWRPADGLPPIEIDPSQFDQVLTNLLVNARDAIADVGKVTIETGAAKFDEAYCADHPGFEPGPYALLAVSDDGVGMDRDTMSKIFEPFFTTKARGAGTGLGLATVFGIVRQNEGFIHVYSEPGEGSTFRIYLPPAAAEEAEEEPVPGTAAPRGGEETILLVEDESALLDLATRMLERLGYRVLTADGPQQALQVAEGFDGDLDLLMTDVVMPRMNGRDLCRALSARRPGLRCLYMSGYTADVIAHHGVLDEGVHFLQKPFTLAALAGRIREALGDPPAS